MPLFKNISCGPGYQVQRRNCSNGAREKCSIEDTERILSCKTHDCPREISNWTNIGTCQGTGKVKTCGNGLQIQSRVCKDGTSIKCSGIERVRTVSCKDAGTDLPKCSSE